jgi:hypothetical protein
MFLARTLNCDYGSIKFSKVQEFPNFDNLDTGEFTPWDVLLNGITNGPLDLELVQFS